MKDGIMYTWEVSGDYDGRAEFICARKETAEYLRDWCQAIGYDYWIGIARRDGLPDHTYMGHCVHYSIEEGEVIL